MTALPFGNPGDRDLAHAIRLGIKPFAEWGANSEALSGSQVDSPCSCRAIFESAPVAMLQSPFITGYLDSGQKSMHDGVILDAHGNYFVRNNRDGRETTASPELETVPKSNFVEKGASRARSRCGVTYRGISWPISMAADLCNHYQLECRIMRRRHHD